MELLDFSSQFRSLSTSDMSTISWSQEVKFSIFLGRCKENKSKNPGNQVLWYGVLNFGLTVLSLHLIPPPDSSYEMVPHSAEQQVVYSNHGAAEPTSSESSLDNYVRVRVLK